MQSQKFVIFTLFCTFACNAIAQEICTPGSNFWPHPDCTKFYICRDDGQHLLVDCLQGLQFDIDRNGCVTPPVPGCEGGTRPPVTTTPIPTTTTPTTTTTTPTTTTPTTTTSNPSICPIGKTFWPHEECSKFYICSCDSPILHDCPDGYFYNSQIESCDNPVFGADCQPGATRPPNP